MFGVLVARLGIDSVIANLQMVGWGIALIIAAEMLAFAANTLGWRAAFPAGVRVPSFGRLLLARIAGDSINYLTPTANLGGEFCEGAHAAGTSGGGTAGRFRRRSQAHIDNRAGSFRRSRSARRR